MLNSKMHSWLDWLLPFLVSGGMVFGALVGSSSGLLDVAREEGSTGETSGAAGALLLLIIAVAGFVMAALTVIVAKARHRSTSGRFALRFGLSVMGGGIISALAVNTEGALVAACWFLLLALPVLLVWFWPEIEEPIE